MRRLVKALRYVTIPLIVTVALIDMHYSNITIEGYENAMSQLDERPTPYFVQLGPERVLMCNTSYEDKRNFASKDSDLPIVYFVTPTHTRGVQLPDITRLGQTLAHVRGLHWIVAEDSYTCSPVVSDLLQRLGIPYTHMATPMPEPYRRKKWKPRGVSNRRGALEWIRRNAGPKAVLYFGDDDNTYDLRLFEEIRSTKHVSMFPVGLIGKYMVSSPVCNNGKVVGFYDSWVAGRRYVIDMAGFAINVDVLRQNPNATMPYLMGYEEDGFLRSLNLDISKIEAKANNCSEIYVWHTKTVNTNTADLNPPSAAQEKHSVDALLEHMKYINLIRFSNNTKQSQVVYLNKNAPATTTKPAPVNRRKFKAGGRSNWRFGRRWNQRSAQNSM